MDRGTTDTELTWTTTGYVVDLGPSSSVWVSLASFIRPEAQLVSLSFSKVNPDRRCAGLLATAFAHSCCRFSHSPSLSIFHLSLSLPPSLSLCLSLPHGRGIPPLHQPPCVPGLTRVPAYGVRSTDRGVSLRASSVNSSPWLPSLHFSLFWRRLDEWLWSSKSDMWKSLSRPCRKLRDYFGIWYLSSSVMPCDKAFHHPPT